MRKLILRKVTIAFPSGSEGYLGIAVKYGARNANTAATATPENIFPNRRNDTDTTFANSPIISFSPNKSILSS